MSDRYACLCCGFLTLREPSPGSPEICHVCYWQDDLLGACDPDSAVGPNAVSLSDARRNFAAYGACEQCFVDSVRRPRPEERPLAGAD